MSACLASARLAQFVGGLVTGTWDIPGLGLIGEIGPAGEPGTIQANGQFNLRFKVRVGSFVDFCDRGTMDPTGQRLTGTLHGSGFTGEYMEFEKQPAAGPQLLQQCLPTRQVALVAVRRSRHECSRHARRSETDHQRLARCAPCPC